MDERQHFSLRLRCRNYRREVADLENKRKVMSKGSPEHNQMLGRLRFLRSELTELNARLSDRDRHTKHKVTDHALVRWLERVQGIDIKRLKDQILIEDEAPEFDCQEHDLGLWRKGKRRLNICFVVGSIPTNPTI